ncbi:MAG: Crp/Fnr family transcriptional regulator [Candidatus Krumholzibacteriia bacterium]
MLTVVEKVIFLQNVEVFEGIPTEQLSYLAAIAEEASFSRGQEMYRFGEVSDALYIVLEGEVRLHRDDEEITVARPSDPFGAWALFDDKPRVATATATDDGRFLRIYREDFLDLLSDHSQITEGVLKMIVGRLRRLLEKVEANIGHKRGN